MIPVASERIDTMAEAAYLAFCRGREHEPEAWGRVSKRRRDGWRRAAIAVLDLRDDELGIDKPASPMAQTSTDGEKA